MTKWGVRQDIAVLWKESSHSKGKEDVKSKIVECYDIKEFPISVGKCAYIFPTELEVNYLGNLQRKYGLTKTEPVISFDGETIITDKTTYKIIHR